VDDWYALWRIARGLGLSLGWNGAAAPMDEAPKSDDLIGMLARSARVPLATVKAARGGRIYAASEARVQSGEPTAGGRFVLLAPDVAAELAALAAEPPPQPGFRLTVRRHREVMNSSLTDFDSVRAKRAGPPAFLHPQALAKLGLGPGDRIRIRSAAGELEAEAQPDADLRQDVVSMAHAWDAVSGDAASVLVSTSAAVQAINRMPVMTAIPVIVSRADVAAQSGGEEGGAA
jgi:anaerobic selenocysteine-containing dehydrogenase